MFSFRQKIVLSYAGIFFIFVIVMFPFVLEWVHHVVIKTMGDRASDIIAYIKEAPNNEALIRRLKDQKSAIFFRISIISDERKVLYDSHIKRLLGPKFSQDYVVNHPEVLQAVKQGVGFHEDYSELLRQKFTYFAKAFDFHGRTYILRTAFPHQYVNEITRDFEIGFLGFAAALLMLFSLMTWFVIHYLTKPIQQIITAIGPYQAGVQASLPAINVAALNPRDDLTKLALTLNSLSEKIQHHINTITHERNEKEAILESLVEGVVAVDVDMRIAYVNHMAAKLIGASSASLVGMPCSFLSQQKWLELLEKCQKEKKALTSTFEISLEGRKIYLEIVAAPKKDDGGAVLVLQDKTEHHKISQMRKDFIANASHELKTPITIIRGFAEALHDNDNLGRETVEQITSKILRNCNRMTALIKDLLTLADIENIPSSRLVKCHLRGLLEKCCSMLLEAYPDAHLEIGSPKKDVELIADPDLLELAFMNLLENAAKYSPKPAHITILFDNEGGLVKVEIADRGIGIPFADQEHVFDRFYTVDKAHSQKMGGSGLGLSIVKTIVEKHFGSIQLYSEPHKGSSFIIQLPILKKQRESDL